MKFTGGNHMNNENQIMYIETGKVYPQIDTKKLPELIQNQMAEIQRLDASVSEAMKSAEKAKKSAIEASEKSAGFGKKKVAIEELQFATVDLAKAVGVGADAQKVSFEFQSKLAEITKCLFALGISNIANNRMVVSELEKRLAGASEEEISESSRNELLQVIQQLKEQQDLLYKLDQVEKKVHFVFKKAETQEAYNQGLDMHLKKINTETNSLNERLFEQKFSIEKLEDQFEAQTDVNKEVETNLSRQKDQLSKNTQLIENQLKLNDAHDQTLEQAQQKIEELQVLSTSLNDQVGESLQLIEQKNVQIKQLQEKEESLSNLIEKKSNATFSKITLGVAIIGTALSIVHFFI